MFSRRIVCQKDVYSFAPESLALDLFVIQISCCVEGLFFEMSGDQSPERAIVVTEYIWPGAFRNKRGFTENKVYNSGAMP